MAFYYKAEGWKLARPVANHALLINDFAKTECLEARESRSNPQVDLLANLHRIG